ncbi:MAG: DUF1415 family protein [Bacteroidota bacterium]
MNGVKVTKLWIERFVIGLRLCPFARYSFYDDTIYYESSNATKLEDCLNDLLSIVQKMDKTSSKNLSNAFVIFNASYSFFDMLDLKEYLDSHLEENELLDQFQFVVFHPEFQFADEEFHASGNFTNRSPLPMIHILREDEVAQAIEKTEDVDRIPYRNKEVLEKIKIKKISEVFEDRFMEKINTYI